MAIPNIVSSLGYVTKPAEWQVIRFKPGVLTGNINVVVTTLPAYTVVLDARAVAIEAPVGDGGCKVDIECGATTGQETELFAGAADNVGAVGKTSTFADEAARKVALDAANAITLAGTPLIVNAEIAWTGTATAPFAMDVYLLCARPEI